MLSSEGITTLETATGFVQFAADLDHKPDPDCFDSARLLELGVLLSKADAGRGNTFFFKWQRHMLVLRHYRRGGLIRHFISKHYWYTGALRTRAAREFQILTHLFSMGLPVSPPYACRVVRAGLFYSASLITYRVPGKTVAEMLLASGYLSSHPEEDERLWRALGSVIARFHAAGVYHADLNAHNILLDDEGGIVLIDFDRARVQQVPRQQGWCLENMRRFERSLKKIANKQTEQHVSTETVSERFRLCFHEWERSLSASIPSLIK